MATDPKPREQDEWRSTLAGIVAAYPAAFRVGIGYWSELASHASSCYVDLLEGLISACRQPGRSSEALGDANRAVREFLQRYGEATERAILDFNERFTERYRSSFQRSTAAPEARSAPVSDRLRDLADQVSIEVLQIQDRQTPADLRSVREQLEGLLQQLRSAESETAHRPSDPPGR